MLVLFPIFSIALLVPFHPHLPTTKGQDQTVEGCHFPHCWICTQYCRQGENTQVWVFNLGEMPPVDLLGTNYGGNIRDCLHIYMGGLWAYNRTMIKILWACPRWHGWEGVSLRENPEAELVGFLESEIEAASVTGPQCLNLCPRPRLKCTLHLVSLLLFFFFNFKGRNNLTFDSWKLTTTNPGIASFYRL